MNASESDQRVVSGMRPTGSLHLGNYRGVLSNWERLQYEFECFFFVADWHALTTHYDETSSLEDLSFQMVVDWLAAGINPGNATLFLQSRVPEHAELHLLLSMITPLGWLERVPTYKDQQDRLGERDLSTYGFLGYPLLQASDILIYRAGRVPVGADQVAHVELTREVARRFNFVYGREPGFEEQAQAAINRLSKRASKLYNQLRKRYQEQGDEDALERAQALLREQQSLSIIDQERLHGFLEGGGRLILPEPQPMLTETPDFPGLDGRKMSKSHDNAIFLREAPDSVSQKIRRMQTDPSRVRRTDPGEPERCPVFRLHSVYSDADTLEWVTQGCRSAGIGCIECKGPLVEAICAEQAPIIERARQYEEDPEMVRSIVAEGSERARDVARETLDEVRAAVGLARG